MFTGIDKCSEKDSNLEYSGVFSHVIGSEDIVIQDELITSEVVGKKRAVTELIKGAYKEKLITLDIIPNLKIQQNDIIEFKGLLYIVKELRISFKPPQLSQIIKGVRYEK